MTTVLISGGNRGIGFGLVERYAARDNFTVIATARNPSSMPQVKTGKGSKMIVVQMDQSEMDSPQKAIDEVKSKGITQLDIVICNAAILTEEAFAKLKDVKPTVFEQHLRVNVLGHLLFYQACVPLMPKGGKFIFMSSGAAVLNREMGNIDQTYGITKTCASFLGRFAHFEEPDLIVFPLDPGWVQTDMGNRAAKSSGLPDGKAPLDIEESCGGIIKLIDGATRESVGGKQMRYDGGQNNW